ncbi:MAG: helix-turn-helix domain-containing protein [Gemmatimonadaceae bacterium]
MEYPARVTREGKFVLASFPDCPGCQTFVREGGDIQSMARDALIGWLEVALESDEIPTRPRQYRSGKGTEIIHIPVPVPLAVRLELRWLRALYDLTQADVARSTGMSQQQIARLEGPRGNPTVDTLERLAKGLGVRLRIDFERTETTGNRDKRARGDATRRRGSMTAR